jgi:predicted amidohydrolase
METVVVATAQQQMRLFQSPEDYRRELARFMQIAQAKGAELIVFPTLSGIPAASPLINGFRVRLLRRAGGSRRNPSALDRARRALAGSTAEMLRANFRRPYRELLTSDSRAVEDAYDEVFQPLAKSYGITVVAGSAYLEATDGGIRHTAIVFGPDGQRLGRHDKVLLSPAEDGWVQPGDGWSAIETPVGRLGLVFGQEVGYPEIGRSLTQQGAGLIVALCVASDEATVAELRLAAIARAQENVCCVVTSYPVGSDYLAADEDGARALIGRSGIYAPLAQTPRFTGVLVEMGATSTEGLLTGELDGAIMAQLREQRAEERAQVVALVQARPPLLAADEDSEESHTLLDEGLDADD